ncbi:uncharacterized [Tachysurus ichikawai]
MLSGFTSASANLPDMSWKTRQRRGFSLFLSHCLAAVILNPLLSIEFFNPSHITSIPSKACAVLFHLHFLQLTAYMYQVGLNLCWSALLCYKAGLYPSQFSRVNSCSTVHRKSRELTSLCLSEIQSVLSSDMGGNVTLIQHILHLLNKLGTP